MKDKLKKLFNSENFYSFTKVIGDYIVNITEPMLKQFIGTYVGGRFLKWFTDILISRFYDTIVIPLIRVGVIRIGYYYDVRESEIIIRKLHEAEQANDDDLYMRTLNDALKRVP